MFAGKIIRNLRFDGPETEENPNDIAEVADAEFKAGKITG